MVKTAILVTLVVVGCSSAMAQGGPDYLSTNRAASRSARANAPSDGVAPNDRCRGMSYGTGARTCGTATGGPVGGINGRN